MFGPNLYTMVTVTGDFSSISARTQMHQGDHSPRWNQEVVFQDVGLAHRLILTVLIHRRLGADSSVGQVSLPIRKAYTRSHSNEDCNFCNTDLRRYSPQASVPLDAFVHGRPQYMWLPLVRSARKLHPTGSIPAGFLRVRIQWAAEDLLEFEQDPGVSVIPNFSLELAFHKGIEVAIVEAGRSSLPREVGPTGSHYPHKMIVSFKTEGQQFHCCASGRFCHYAGCPCAAGPRGSRLPAITHWHRRPPCHT